VFKFLTRLKLFNKGNKLFVNFYVVGVLQLKTLFKHLIIR